MANLHQDIFEELESRTREFGIRNLQLGLGTLEDVFLNIVKKAELESDADASQDTRTIITLASGASLRVNFFFFFCVLVNNYIYIYIYLAYSRMDEQIPVGARYVKIPGTESEQNPHGRTVEVFWKQDDRSNLCIAKHSEEKPVPSSLQPICPSSSGNVSSHGEEDHAAGIPLE